MRDAWDVDALQAELYQRAGLPDDEPANMLDLARGLGLAVVQVHAPRFPGDAVLVHTPDGWTIYLRARVSRERKRFALAHEIVEWVIGGKPDEHIESAVNACAGALLAPRRAFRRLARDVGDTNFEQLALPFGITQTGAALRSGETLGVELAVDRPGLVRVRGLRTQWPAEEVIRGWARGVAPAGLAKVVLTDEPRRVALVVSGDD